jgi:putative DNA primase/helicase
MRKLDIRHPVFTFPVINQRGAPSSKHVENTEALVEAYKIEVRYNLMRHSLEMRIPGFETESERSENSTVQCFKSLVQRHGLSPENSLGHLQFLADSYHPVRDWILGKPWDGVDRMQQFMDTIDLVQASKSGLAGTLLTRWLVGAVRAVMPDTSGGRPFTPQGVLTFQGPQGIGKTEWFKSLAPQDKEWVCTGRVLDPHNRDSIQQTTSYWIAELGELDATFKRSDVVAMKAFVTQPFDVYRSAYAMREERIPRRTMLGASVNPREFLADETGNRRWWTVAVKSLNWGHTVDMQQLWAQVAVMVAQGQKWWLDQDEIQNLNLSNEDHEIVDPLVADLWETWKVPVLADVSKYPRVKLAEVWSGLPGRESHPMDNRQSRILAEALRKMGALNEGKTNGLATYRVERIKPVPAYSGFTGYSGFNPSTYKD